MPLPDPQSGVQLHEVPYHRQESPNTCLPACLRMCLEWLGASYGESALVALLQTGPLGTRPDDVTGALSSLGYDVVQPVHPTLEWLESRLTDDQIIVVGNAIRAGLRRSLHAVVLIGMYEHQVTFHDPLRGAAQKESLSAFMLAWELAGFPAFSIAPE